jgi:hypothetical protein
MVDKTDRLQAAAGREIRLGDRVVEVITVQLNAEAVTKAETDATDAGIGRTGQDFTGGAKRLVEVDGLQKARAALKANIRAGDRLGMSDDGHGKASRGGKSKA